MMGLPLVRGKSLLDMIRDQEEGIAIMNGPGL